MNVSDTSKLAYTSIKESLSDRQEQVYKALKERKEATNEELSDYLHLPIQSITGRVNELCNRFNLIEKVGYRKTKSGRTATVWAPKYRTFEQARMF